MHFKCAVAMLAIAAGLPLCATADIPGLHPGYLHAIAGPRAARSHFEHKPGDRAVTCQEDVAVAEIDRAIEEACRGAREDEKDLRDQPREDARLDRPGRLRCGLDLLRKAHDNLLIEEDSPEA